MRYNTNVAFVNLRDEMRKESIRGEMMERDYNFIFFYHICEF